MLKEIQKISHAMTILNSQVHGKILSSEELDVLKNALTNMQFMQNNINNLLHDTSLSPATNEYDASALLVKIHKSLSQLGISVETIYELSTKFVCNYEEEWDLIRQIN